MLDFYVLRLSYCYYLFVLRRPVDSCWRDWVDYVIMEIRYTHQQSFISLHNRNIVEHYPIQEKKTELLWLQTDNKCKNQHLLFVFWYFSSHEMFLFPFFYMSWNSWTDWELSTSKIKIRYYIPFARRWWISRIYTLHNFISQFIFHLKHNEKRLIVLSHFLRPILNVT